VIANVAFCSEMGEFYPKDTWKIYLQNSGNLICRKLNIKYFLSTSFAQSFVTIHLPHAYLQTVSP
jgi:hypothetical protein